MMRTPRALIAALLSACTLTTAALTAMPAGASASAVPRDFFGLVAEDALTQQGPSHARIFDQLAATGIGMLRETFDWSQIELKPGSYDFSAYDRFVGDAARHGIQILPVLFNPPAFRSGRPAHHAKRGTYPPASYGDFAHFAQLAVQRYGPGGSFWSQNPSIAAMPIHSWQVWNEPNLPVYWASGPSAAQYAALLKVAYRAIKQVDPTAEVVTAGMPQSKLGIPLTKYIRGLYQAGAGGNFNTIAVNPYATTAGGVVHFLRQVRSLMNREGDGSSSIRATELGWANSASGAPEDGTSGQQAARIGQALRALATARQSLKLAGVIYYSWRDLPVYQGGKDFWGLHTGLVAEAGQPKPALRTFTSVVRQLVG
jgi:hypothetical protein